MATYEQLKKVLDHETKLVSKPLAFDKEVREFVKSVEEDDVTETNIIRVLNSTNKYLSKRYGQFFHRQAILQIIQQVLNNEHALDLEKKRKLLELNEILINFKPEGLVDLNGNYNDERGASNININGVVDLKQEEVMGMIDELPESTRLTAKDPELLEKYQLVKAQLSSNRARLLELQGKTKYYRETRKKLEELTEPTQDPDSTLQKNLVLNTNDQLVNQVSQTRILLAMVKEKLQDGQFAEKIQEKLKVDLK